MAELKYKITVEGVEKALANASKLEAELEQIKKLYKEKHNVIIDNKQAIAALQAIKEEQRKANDELESIGKNVRFANFKAAMKSISGELVTLASTAATSGKSVSENINDVGKSVAGIASNFGIAGAAAGALITVITPVIASMFELSAAEKAVESVTKDATTAINAELGALQANISVVNDKTASEEELKLAKDSLIKQYPEYFAGLDIEKLTKEQLLTIEKQLTEQIIKTGVAKAKEAKRNQAFAAILDLELQKKKAIANQEEENLLRLGRVATGGISGLGAAFEQNAVDKINDKLKEQRDILDAIDKVGEEIVDNYGNQVKLTDKLSNSFLGSFGQGGAGLKGSQNQPKGTAAPEKDLTQFGDQVDVVTKQLEELLAGDFLDPTEFKRGLDTREELVRAYLSTIKGDSDAVKKLTDENLALEKEAVDVANKKVAATKREEAALKEVLGLLAIGRTQRLDRTIVIGDPNQTTEELARIKKVGQEIANLYKSGAISQEEARKRLEQNGILTPILTKEEDAVKASTKRIEDIQKTLERNQREIEAKGGSESNKERRRLLEERLKLEEEFGKQQEKVLKFQIEQELKVADASRKAVIEAGRAQFESATNEINRLANEEVNKLSDIQTKAAAQANLLAADVVTKVGNTLVIDPDKYASALQTLDQTQRQILESSINTIEDGNATIVEINLKRNADIRNASVKFVDEFITIYKQLNAAELRDLVASNQLSIQELRNYEEDRLNLIKKRVQDRRKLNKKQTDEEVGQIRLSREQSLQALKIAQEKEFELLVEQKQKELDLAKAAGADVTVQQKELDFIKIGLVRKFKKEEEDVNKEYNGFIDDGNKKTLDSYAKDFNNTIAPIIKQLQNFSNSVLDLINQNSQNIVDNLNEQLRIVEDSTTQTLDRIAQLEDDLEGKRSGRREAVLQALEQQREIEQDLAKQRIALAEQVAAEEKKINKRKQAASIANALINGALAITNVFATSAPPLSFILAGITAATTAVQVATIASQKFAKGGFTGPGSQRDETGHKVAGVVHNDEWVAPKWMVESPKFSGVISQLENARQKGYADGGFTSPDFNALGQAVNPNPTSRMERMLAQYAEASLRLADRPVKVSATEIQNTANINSGRKARITT